jgi:hypothetical protein
MEIRDERRIAMFFDTSSVTRLALGAAAVAALGLAVVAAGNPAPTAGLVTAAQAAATFTDPAGDAPGAPDITSVSLADDPATGTITLEVTAVGFATAAPASGGENLVKAYINADRNESTGSADQDGAEYTLGAWKDADGSSGWGMSRWNGTKYALMAQSPSMRFMRTGDSLTWTFGKADIGRGPAFDFYLWGSTWDAGDNLVAEDTAPDDGWFSYTLTAATATAPTPVPPKPVVVKPVVVKPVIAVPIATPKVAVSGKRFTIVFPVTRSDNGQPLTSGKLTFDPSVLGKVIPHTESFAGGKARLSLVIPTTARARRLKVKVTVVTGTQSATRIAGFPVA